MAEHDNDLDTAFDDDDDFLWDSEGGFLEAEEDSFSSEMEKFAKQHQTIMTIAVIAVIVLMIGMLGFIVVVAVNSPSEFEQRRNIFHECMESEEFTREECLVISSDGDR